MSRVNILSPELISKIAAGEVVERPASVVKELLENSIDAGSTSIELHLKDGGKTLIHIKDNGSGIEREDLNKIFARHATSKIKTSDDLYDIHTLGFRGEALYSIGAVSDVILQSRTKEQDSGWEIHVLGGQKKDIRPCQFNHTGTDIKVQELFFNTPARKKFLSSTTAEINQVLNLVIPHAMLNKQVRFLLTHQGKSLLDLSSTENTKSRIAETLNLEEKYLIETEHHFTEQNFKAHLILGDVNITRNRRDLQFIFVNGRPVENKNISYHINNIYRLVMPEKTYPFFAVFLEIDPQDVDANVHPTKKEVKIKNEASFCAVLRSMTEEALMKSSRPKQMTSAETITPTQPLSYSADKITKTIEEPGSVWNNSGSYSKQNIVSEYTVPSFTPQEQSEMFTQLAQNHDGFYQKLSSAQFIGVFLNKYLIYQTTKSLLLIDQHAAAERVTFEQLITQIQKSTLEVQHLLTPCTIKLTPQELLTWEESKDLLSLLGFETTEFGNNTIAVHSHPVLIKNIELSIREVLSEGGMAKRDIENVARRACRGSVMTGDQLKEAEIKSLHKRLLACLDPFTCPHGRPTVIEVTEEFISKQFLR